MRRVALFLSVLMVAMAGIYVLADAPELGPGGVHVRGTTNNFAAFQLYLNVKQASPDLFRILAVKVYTNPSHTLMFAFIDDSAPISVLQDIQAETPRAMATGTIGRSEPSLGISAPPRTDKRVTVEYVVGRNGATSSFTMSDITVSSVAEFEFSSEPMVGGNVKHCGWCGGEFCGCIYCQGPGYTLCCPDCTLVCGVILCP